MTSYDQFLGTHDQFISAYSAMRLQIVEKAVLGTPVISAHVVMELPDPWCWEKGELIECGVEV
jgi:hypothetical protein